MRRPLLLAALLVPLAAPSLDGRAQPVAPSTGEVFVESATLAPVYFRYPESHDPKRSYPLLIALHGRGGTAAELYRAWDVWEKPRFLFAVPQGPYPLGPGFSWSFPSRDRQLWERADPLISRYVLDVAAEVKKKAKVGPVYLLGFSQGVAYAYLTALLNPGAVDGVICFAGHYPAEALADKVDPVAAKRLRLFVAHGRQDEVVPPRSSLDAKQALEKLGATVTYREFEGGHLLPQSVLREVQTWLEKP